ncbi:MAG: LLM class flavin-dependent oxidoreductase [Gammaproteobacteria bacterium]|nr:LLM class flavin-dependent oxidoreductase [Gammaproteobacteria bacterium]
MRLSLFLHMERLGSQPDDATLYRQMLELCTLADRSGFHAIWIGEHHGMNFTMSPNPFLHIVDLARRTRNVRLGTATIVAPFWHPLKLAGEAAMTDILSDGRLDLGLARGAYEFEYERLSPGLTAALAGERLREMVTAVRGLWRGDYAHDGAHWQFPVTTSAPKPMNAAGPPLWIAARDPASHDFAVANNCHVQVTPLWQDDEEVARLYQRFDSACEAHAAGPPGQPRPQIMLLRHTIVSESEAELRAGASDLSRFYNYFGSWFKNERPAEQGSLRPMTAAELAQNAAHAPETMRRNNVVGTPAEVISRLRYYEQLGFDEYALWLDNTSDFDAKERSLRCFIQHVMPAFADSRVECD